MINEIDNNLRRPEIIRICVYQIDLTKVDIKDYVSTEFITDSAQVKDQIDHAIKLGYENDIDLLVFPELSIPTQYIGQLVDFSKKNNTIVVAGSHYHEEENKFINRCPVIIRGEIHFIHKNTPSILEKSPIKFQKSLVRGNEITYFKRTSIGNFVVAICADYLNVALRQEILKLNPDIIVVIALQSNSDKYFTIFNSDCYDSKHGIYFIYNNVFIENKSDGRSSIFGHLDKHYSKAFQDSNVSDLNPPTKLISLPIRSGYFISDMNIEVKKPFLPHSIEDDPNISLVDWSIDAHPESDDFLKVISASDEKYKYIKQLYVEPEEYNSILDVLNSKNIVFLIGDPGIGKTYTSIKILNEYYENGYNVEWVKGLHREERSAQVKELQNYVPSKKSITYFEDPFGRTEFENVEVLYSLFSPLIDRIKHQDSKVIVTSRKEVFERFLSKSLHGIRFKGFTKEMNIVKPSYGSDRLINILNRLLAVLKPWKDQEKCSEIVIQAIRKEVLNTPLSIRDIVYSSTNIATCDEMITLIENRSKDNIKIYAKEIETTTVPIKIFLLLVYLLEYRNINIIEDIFEKTVGRFSHMQEGSNLASFQQILRSQVGYRVEKISNVSKGVRFNHPSYEESIVHLIGVNNQFNYLLDKVVDVIIQYDFLLIVNCINRLTIKSKTIAKLIFERAIDQAIFLTTTKRKLIYLSNELIRAYIKTEDNDFLKLVERLYNNEHNLVDLFTTEDIGELHQSVKFYYNLKKVHPSYSSNSNLLSDSKKLLIDNLHNSDKLGYVIGILEYIHLLDKDMATEVIESKVGIKLVNELFRIDDNDRRRLINLYNRSKYKKEVTKKVNKIGFKSKQNRKKISKSFYQDNYVIVDKGAEKAIHNGFNLLPAGIVSTSGSFFEKDRILVKDLNKETIASGITRYSSEDIESIKGCHSSLIYDILGFSNGGQIAASETIFIGDDSAQKNL